MGRRALYLDGHKPTVIHAYCEPTLYAEFEEVMNTRGIPESKLIQLCLTKALPQVAQENPPLDEQAHTDFLARQLKRSYKHKKSSVKPKVSNKKKSADSSPA